MVDSDEHVRTVTSKGQVTIPIEVRRLLGLKPRDQVAFRMSDGRVAIEPVEMTLAATFGAVTPRRRPEDYQAPRDVAIEEHVQSIVDEMR